MTGAHDPGGRAGEYRRHMRDCIKAVMSAADEQIRARLLDLAFEWGKLAKQIDQLEPEPPKNEDLRGVQVVVITGKRRH
jgi:hypothetical protein